MIKLIILSVFSLFSTVYAQVSTAKWQVQPIAIDGDGSDWGMLPRFFNTESNIKYEFRNDAQNLYFILKAGDRAVQMQLLKAGFSIRFKLKTSTPVRTEIKFLPNRRTELPQMINSQDGGIQRLVDKSVTQPEIILKDSALLDGFQYTNGLITSEKKDENGICFARSKAARDLAAYEVRIPLRELFGDNYNLSTIATVPMQLQINVNDLSMNEIKKMRTKMGGGIHGGGRGMGGGGRGMGEGGMGNEMPGGEISEMPGSEGGGELQSGMRGGFSMERKSFNKDFMLSSGK
ncbi:MAG: hypothetical protein WCK78_01000 [Paludibacter sp.]